MSGLNLTEEFSLELRGRPSTLSRDVMAEVVRLFEEGNTLRDVAAYIGVPARTISNWLTNGKRAKYGLHREFYIECRRARAKARIRNLALIRAEAEGIPPEIDPKTGKPRKRNWYAAAWYLERVDPKHYGRRNPDTQVNIVNQQQSLKLDLSRLTLEEMVSLRNLLDKASVSLPG